MFLTLMTSVIVGVGGPTPIYLRCSFSNKTDVMITADEGNSSVTVALPSTGYSEKIPAAFTATEVRFQNRMLSYVINRTDLSAVRTIRSINSTDAGHCQIETAPKRVF